MKTLGFGKYLRVQINFREFKVSKIYSRNFRINTKFNSEDQMSFIRRSRQSI